MHRPSVWRSTGWTGSLEGRAPAVCSRALAVCNGAHRAIARTQAGAAPAELASAPVAALNRRQAAALMAAAAAPWVMPRQPAHAEASSESAKASFYSDWPYIGPADILPYLRATATRGDVDSVLAAIDRFAEFYPMYRCGPEKGAILERLVSQQRPQLAVELGTFMGYGAARIARQLPPGGRLVSIEASQEQAEVARQVLEFAGISVGEGTEARVQVVHGLSGDVLPRLRELAGLAPEQGAGFVFLDHCKPCYLPDLLTMERLSLVAPGTLIVADNVIVPGAPDYLQHVGGTFGTFGGGAIAENSSSGGSSSGESSSSSGGKRAGRGGSSSGSKDGEEGALAYSTTFEYTAFEVEQRFKKDWQPKRDAMSVSLCI